MKASISGSTISMPFSFAVAKASASSFSNSGFCWAKAFSAASSAQACCCGVRLFQALSLIQMPMPERR